MIRCYKFGLLDPVSGFNESAVEHLFLRNKLWNNLVALDREFRQKYRDLMLNSDEELSTLQSSIDSINLGIDALVTEKKKIRQKERSKNIDTKMIDEKINQFKANRKELSERIKIVRVRVKMEISPKITELSKEQYEATKAIRQDSGLWWGNYETVMESYEVARVKAMKSNAELQFKRFDGTGKFAVRFGDGGLTFDELIAGESNDLRIESIDTSHLQNLSRRGVLSRARHHIKISVFSSKDENGKKMRNFIELPMVMHREMAEGKIKFIHVQRRRVGNQFNWTCSITMKTDEEPATVADHTSKMSCGIDLGYRLVKDGLRVAMLVDTQGQVESLVIPQVWIDKMDYAEKLQGELSDEMTLMWARLKKELSGIAEYPELLQENIANMMKMGDKLPFGGIKRLYKALRADEGLLPSCLSILNDWDKATYRREREVFNLRDKLLSRRKHLYRNFAHMVSNTYAHVIVEDMKLSEIAKTEKSETVTNDMPSPVKANRQRAALYELVDSIKLSCIKTGSIFEKADAAYSSVTCSSCGHVNESTDAIHFTCKGCGTMHDVDENAAKNFLNGEDSYSQKMSA